jgi:hypothetical protein
MVRSSSFGRCSGTTIGLASCPDIFINTQGGIKSATSSNCVEGGIYVFASSPGKHERDNVRTSARILRQVKIAGNPRPIVHGARKGDRIGSEGNVTCFGSVTAYHRGRKSPTMSMPDDDGLLGAEFGFESDEEEDIKEKRTVQSEDDFLKQKSEWTPKVERREV